MLTFPRTLSSTTKFLPVISLMNLARTGMSTSWKFIVMRFWSCGDGGSSARTCAHSTLVQAARASAPNNQHFIMDTPLAKTLGLYIGQTNASQPRPCLQMCYVSKTIKEKGFSSNCTITTGDALRIPDRHALLARAPSRAIRVAHSDHFAGRRG